MPSSPFYMRRPEPSSPPPEGCNFVVYAKNIFLTYPHCSLDPKYLAERLQTHCSNHNPNFVAAVRETHKDGSFHLHALVMCSRRIYIRSARWFDIDGFHPNFQSTRHPTAVYSNLNKEGTPYEIGSFQSPFSRAAQNKDPASTPPKNRSFRDIVESSTSANDFLIKVRDTFPYEWATKLKGLEYAASRLYPIHELTYEIPDDQQTFVIPQELQDWCRSNLIVTSRNKVRRTVVYRGLRLWPR